LAATAAAPPSIPTFGSDEWKAGESYIVRRAAGAITVDKTPHPEQWKNAMAIRGFFAAKSTTAPARSRTEAMMLWDDQHLYVQAVASDADLRGKFKERTDPLWEEDVVELFLKPRDDRPAYYEFEVNPIGTVMALQIDNRKDKKPIKDMSAWETGIAAAVQAEGTVNDSSDADQFYRVILAIPWKHLVHLGGKPPQAGDAWKFTFCRNDLSKLYRKAEESNSAPMTTDDWHRYEQYSTLTFQR
jgi:hypothetical protein